MKALFKIFGGFLLAIFLFTSCEKKEKPYPLPPPGNAQTARVDIGPDYANEIFFSFSDGMISTGKFASWDIALNTDPDQNELWLNGGKNVLIYPTGQSSFTYQLPPGLSEKDWKYDQPSQLPGQSGLGRLSPQNHMNELLIVRLAEKDYKLKITEATPAQYTIEVGDMAATQGTSVVLPKDTQYNFIYFSFADGIVRPAPPKTKWDIVFTRYRTVFKGLNPDGSDMPYLVNGVLTNPYRTTAGDDSSHNYDFNTFSLEDAEKFTQYPDRDIIGYDWKLVNIQTAEYTVLPKRIFVVKDQNGGLWKLHFVSFYGPDGTKGMPQFEYKRLD